MIQIWTARNPQGYEYRQFGTSDRTLLDFEGLALVTVMKKAPPPKAAGPDTSDLLTTDPPPKGRKPRTPKPKESPPEPLPTAWMFEPSQLPEGAPPPEGDANRNTPDIVDEQLDSEMPW